MDVIIPAHSIEKVKEQLRLFGDGTYELEARFGRFEVPTEGGVPKFVSDVGYMTFGRMIKYLDSFFRKDNITSCLDIDVGNGMRMTVCGDSNIELFHQFMHVGVIAPDQIHYTRKDTSTKALRVDVHEYGYRLALSKEKTYTYDANSDARVPLTTDTSRGAARVYVAPDGDTFAVGDNMTFKSYRYKRRYTYSAFDNPHVRYDATIVYSANELHDTLEKYATSYEFEVEFLKGADTEVVRRQLLEFVVFVQDTGFLVSQTEYNAVKQEYADLIKKIRGGTQNGELFIGLQPTTVTAANVREVRITERYSVTDKADGERYLGYIARDGFFYLINSRLRFVPTGLYVENQMARQTLFDGEYVENQYLIFDIFVFGGVDCRNEILYDVANAGNENTRFRRMERGVQFFKDAKITRKAHVPRSISIHLKKYVFPSADTPLRACIDAVYGERARSEKRYHIDGVIFTPMDETYPNRDAVGRTWRTTFKWKPPSENTVDFLVQYEPGTATPYGGGEVQRCVLHVGRRTGKTYGSCVFEPPNLANTKFDKDAVSNMFVPLKDGVPMSLDGHVLPPGCIVECGWERLADTYDTIQLPHEFGWVPKRLRLEKTQLLHDTGELSGTLNDQNTAYSIWGGILSPLGLEDVVAAAAPPAKDGAYYTATSRVQDAQPMHRFHNYIKYLLLKGAAEHADGLSRKRALVDLTCGRGGDLNKWSTLRLDAVLGMDLSADNLFGADGMHARLKKMRGVPFKYVFLAHDARVPVFDAGGQLVAEAVDQTISKNPRGAEVAAFHAAHAPFSMVATFFSLHYFFKDEMSLDSLVQNVSRSVALHGRWVMTCIDGDRLYEKWRGKSGADAEWEESVRGNKVFHLKKMYTDGDGPNQFGCRIQVKFHSISDEFYDEWLVFGEVLDRVARRHGLHRVEKTPFSAISKTSSVPEFQDAARLMTQELAALREYSDIHTTYVYEKVTMPADEYIPVPAQPVEICVVKKTPVRRRTAASKADGVAEEGGETVAKPRRVTRKKDVAAVEPVESAEPAAPATKPAARSRAKVSAAVPAIVQDVSTSEDAAVVVAPKRRAAVRKVPAPTEPSTQDMAESADKVAAPKTTRTRKAKPTAI